MKPSLVMFALFLISLKSTFAQLDSSGIYLNAEDFSSGKLSYAISCKTEKHAIRLNDFFGRPFITVIYEGKKIRVNKKDIFGYRCCDNENYRWFDNKDYRILAQTKKIVLYSYTTPSAPRYLMTTKYFFSKGIEKDIQALTLTNVKNILPSNHKYHNEIDKVFKNDNELMSYDNFHKQYKLIGVIEQFQE